MHPSRMHPWRSLLGAAIPNVGLLLGLCACASGPGADGQPSPTEPVSTVSDPVLLMDGKARAIYWAPAGGYRFACALLEGGVVKCWGYNVVGQLGVGDTITRGDGPGEMGSNLPNVSLGTGLYATAIAVGRYHACALLNNGKVKCWGDNGSGELGYGDTRARGINPADMGDNLPFVDLGTGRTVRSIAAGVSHTCAVLDSSELKCWGYNGVGQLGYGDTRSRGASAHDMGDNLPVVNLGTGRTPGHLAAGGYYTCASLDNGKLKCWGLNDKGQLGLGDTRTRGINPADMGDNLPAVDLGSTVIGVYTLRTASGYLHPFTCARIANNGATQIKCWGDNAYGQLGLGDTINRGDGAGPMGDQLPAVNLGTSVAPIDIALGDTHACALSCVAPCSIAAYKSVKCWGRNYNGQLGYGNLQNRGDGPNEMGDYLPTVAVGGSVTGLGVQDLATCVTLYDRRAKCWGNNDQGQLGYGDTTQRGDNLYEMGDALPLIDLG